MIRHIASAQGRAAAPIESPGRGGVAKPSVAVCSNCHHRAKCPLSATSDVGCLPGGLLAEQVFEAEINVLVERDHFDRIYVVKSGSLQVSVTGHRGGQAIIGFGFPNAVIGIEALESDRYPYTIKTLEKSRLCSIEKKELIHAMRVKPEFQLSFLGVIGRQLMQEKQVSLALYRGSVETRTAAFILHLYTHYHDVRNISLDIVLSMPRSTISSYMGITPESLSRCLSSLGKKGVISVFNRRISILDIDKLRLLALEK